MAGQQSGSCLLVLTFTYFFPGMSSIAAAAPSPEIKSRCLSATAPIDTVMTRAGRSRRNGSSGNMSTHIF